MLYHTINQTDYNSSEKEDTVSKKLENLIENLKTNFSPDSIKEVRILFKEVAKAEKIKNEGLLKEVQNLNAVLDIISEERNTKNKQLTDPENGKIVEVLNQILKTTT